MLLTELRYRLIPLKTVQAKKKKRKPISVEAIIGHRRKSLSDAAKAGLVVIPNKIRKRFAGAVK